MFLSILQDTALKKSISAFMCQKAAVSLLLSDTGMQYAESRFAAGCPTIILPSIRSEGLRGNDISSGCNSQVPSFWDHLRSGEAAVLPDYPADFLTLALLSPNGIKRSHVPASAMFKFTRACHVPVCLLASHGIAHDLQLSERSFRLSFSLLMKYEGASQLYMLDERQVDPKWTCLEHAIKTYGGVPQV